MRIIGIAGPAGSGKDTLALAFTELGFARVSFATPIKDALNAMFGFEPEQWEDREWKEAELEEFGVSPRHLAQTLGTEWGRQFVADDLWVRLALNKADDERIVISDVRFDNEADAIRQAGGLIVHLKRPGCAPVKEHVSEAGIAHQPDDHTLMNDGTIEQLHASARTVYVKELAARYPTMVDLDRGLMRGDLSLADMQAVIDYCCA